MTTIPFLHTHVHFDPYAPLSQALLDVLPLHTWSVPLAVQRFLMQQAVIFLLERGCEIPDEHEQLRAIVRAAWRSAGLLVEAKPGTTFFGVIRHVQAFLESTCQKN